MATKQWTRPRGSGKAAESADVAAAQNAGVTALIGAVFYGHEAVAKLLLDRRADMAAADNDGNTALVLAARGSHEAVAELLLDHRADMARLTG